MSDVAIHSYTMDAVRGDYLRGGIGLALTGGPLVIAGASGPALYILGALALLFGGYLLRTAMHHHTRILADDTGLRAEGARRTAIRWQSVDWVRLRYYSTRRDRKGGWLELKLRGGDGKLGVDSSVSEFEALTGRVAEAALQNQAEMDPTTRENFALMGLDLDAMADRLEAGRAMAEAEAPGDDGA